MTMFELKIRLRVQSFYGLTVEEERNSEKPQKLRGSSLTVLVETNLLVNRITSLIIQTKKSPILSSLKTAFFAIRKRYLLADIIDSE